MKVYQKALTFNQKIIPLINFFVYYYKSFNKSILFLMIFFSIALFPLFRANINFLDDSSRALYGDRGWAYLYSRWVSEYLSVLIHVDTFLRDIAPFTQLIAIFLISLASVLLCWIIFDKKLTKIGILLSALLGLTPFFLESFAFKFDSPYMALSVFASVLPFLFAFKNSKIFALVSFFCLLIVFTTYQFSSGIYIMITIFLLFQNWNTKSKSLSEMKDFFLIALVSYVGALTIFRFFLLQTKIFEYHTVFTFKEMFLGVLDNYKDNFANIVKNFNDTWIWILAIMIIFFVIKSIIVSKQNKFFSFLITLVVLILLFLFFQGFFIFVDIAGISPRYLIGFNTFVVLIALQLAKPPYKIFAIPAIVLLYCFFIFTFAFGNALEYQKDYKTFFATMLIGDLSKIVADKDMLKEKTSIYFMNPIGNSPVIKSLQKDYPIIKHLIPNDFGNHVFGYTNLEWYNFPTSSPKKIEKHQKQEVKNLPILVNSYYYTIRSDDNNNLYIWFNK